MLFLRLFCASSSALPLEDASCACFIRSSASACASCSAFSCALNSSRAALCSCVFLRRSASAAASAALCASSLFSRSAMQAHIATLLSSSSWASIRLSATAPSYSALALAAASSYVGSFASAASTSAFAFSIIDSVCWCFSFMSLRLDASRKKSYNVTSLLLPCRNFLACSCVSTAHGLSALMLKCSHSRDTSPLFTFIRPEPSPRER
mmetsp:Transcript_36345/g.120343  ORF Transcript_36345/g.120343 Transcript_36345/m.120343 type:complete len:208 (-) Transcript_36345:489-1112(-)